VQHITKSLADAGVEFEEKNPVTSLMADTEQGLLNPEILNEKVMSVIIEFNTAEADIVETLELLRKVSKEIPSIMAIGLSVRCDEHGQTDIEEVLRDLNFEFNRAKTNIGIGRAQLAAVSTA
jgi:hypothetical protein